MGRQFGEFIRERVDKFELNIKGIEHLEGLRGQAFLVVSNHIKPKSKLAEQSQLAPDAFILENIVKEHNDQQLMILAKADNGKWRLGEKGKGLQRQLERPFKAVVKGMGMIPVHKNPGSFNREMFEGVEAAVGRKDAILVFPEGDWKEDFDPNAELEPGAGHLAHKFNLPILPVYIRGADNWKPGQVVEISFGEAFHATGQDKGQVTEEIRNKIAALQADVRA